MKATLFQLELLLRMKVALDTANGAASTSARQIFADLGAQLTVIGETPDGLNINLMLVQLTQKLFKMWSKKAAQLLVWPLTETVTV